MVLVVLPEAMHYLQAHGGGSKQYLPTILLDKVPIWLMLYRYSWIHFISFTMVVLYQRPMV
jgi:hypothetical protein